MRRLLLLLVVLSGLPSAAQSPDTEGPPMADVVGTMVGLTPNGLTGRAPGERFGALVADAGDVNGDGFADVIVGAAGNDAGGVDAGRAYLFFGSTAMQNAPAVTLTGAVAGDAFGSSVSGAGDVNGDGSDDVILGAYTNDAGGLDAGRAYLHLSTSPPAPPRLVGVRDVPDDQGGVVTAEWTRSASDGEGDGRVTKYLVERSRPVGVPAWEPVATIPATERTRYSAVVPTYGVPAEGTSMPVRIQVTARTARTSQY